MEFADLRNLYKDGTKVSFKAPASAMLCPILGDAKANHLFWLTSVLVATMVQAQKVTKVQELRKWGFGGLPRFWLVVHSNKTHPNG